MEEVQVKHKRIVLIFTMLLVFIGLVACSKKVDKSKAVKPKKVITSGDIIDKAIEKYESMNVTDYKIECNGTLSTSEEKSMNIDLLIKNYYVDKEAQKCITNINFKLNVDKKENIIDLYVNEFGNVVYSLNKSDYYSADEMYSMLGINYSAPKLDVIMTNITPRKMYSILDLKDISNKLILGENSEIDGVEYYVLKGTIKSVEISNFLVKNITEGLYNIHKEFGDIDYEIYVNKDTYEINNVMLDCKQLVSVLSGGEERDDNKINLNIVCNSGEKLSFPKGKAFELEKYSDILNVISELTSGFKNMKIQ